MEFWLPFNSLTLFLFSSFIFLLIKVCKKNISQSKPEKLPPGPPKLPLIGNLHQLLLLGGLPHHALQLLARKHGPVMHLQLGQVSTVVISSREAAKEVLKTHDPACADRPESMAIKILCYDYTDIVFSPYNDHWRKMRRICVSELLSPKSVDSFGPIRLDEARRLVESLRSSSGQPTNLTDEISTFVSSVTCRAAFGQVGERDKESLMVMMKEGVTKGGGFGLTDLFPSFKLLRALSWSRYKLMGMRREMDKILDGVLEEHKMKTSGEFGGEDIVDVLLRMQRIEELEFPITDDHIKAVIFDMFSAGTETSSNVVDWAVAELMRNPGVMEKAQTEIREAFRGKTEIEESGIRGLKYLKLVVKETLRLHPPFPMILRACRDECEVDAAGYTIPVRSSVMVNIWGMGRDPEYWEEPNEFCPERFEDSSVSFLGSDFEFIPFGAGKRICPGVSFGLVNVELALVQILYHFDWEMPEGISAPDMTEGEGLAAPRKNKLVVVPRVYQPLPLPTGN